VVVWGGCDGGGGVVVVERLYFSIVCYLLSITFFILNSESRAFF
jgi:hypothetical protein